MRDAISDKDASSCVTVYDPLFSPQDVAVLARLGMTLPESNNCGAYTLREPTIIYMPHCPREMYEALLRSNWSLDLRSFAICGNDFDDYACV